MKRLSVLALAAATAASLAASMPLTPGRAAGESSPVFGVTIPAGYRQWELIAPSHVPSFAEIRAIMGNATAMKAYRERALPFPDGAMLAKLAWEYAPSAEFAGAFVPGRVTSVQFMVKDSRKYAATGGWGFGKFIDGKPTGEAEHKACFGCHEANVKGHDLVFTRFAP